jgi:hypothetical protein
MMIRQIEDSQDSSQASQQDRMRHTRRVLLYELLRDGKSNELLRDEKLNERRGPRQVA